jgi:hypothetical protein
MTFATILHVDWMVASVYTLMTLLSNCTGSAQRLAHLRTSTTIGVILNAIAKNAYSMAAIAAQIVPQVVTRIGSETLSATTHAITRLASMIKGIVFIAQTT